MRTATRTALTAGLCLALLGTGASAGGAARRDARAVAAPYCGITWGSATKTGGDLRTPGLLRVTTSRDTCWDRVTFEFAGPVDGYQVGYATEVPTEGQGLDLVPFTAGGAHLSVSLRAPGGTVALTGGQHAATVLGSATLRDVVFGGSFEGYTQFAAGVRARLPFRVVLLPGPGTHSRIAIDVAHQW